MAKPGRHLSRTKWRASFVIMMDGLVRLIGWIGLARVIRLIGGIGGSLVGVPAGSGIVPVMYVRRRSPPKILDGSARERRSRTYDVVVVVGVVVHRGNYI